MNVCPKLPALAGARAVREQEEAAVAVQAAGEDERGRCKRVLYRSTDLDLDPAMGLEAPRMEWMEESNPINARPFLGTLVEYRRGHRSNLAWA